MLACLLRALKCVLVCDFGPYGQTSTPLNHRSITDLAARITLTFTRHNSVLRARVEHGCVSFISIVGLVSLLGTSSINLHVFFIVVWYSLFSESVVMSLVVYILPVPVCVFILRPFSADSGGGVCSLW